MRVDVQPALLLLSDLLRLPYLLVLPDLLRLPYLPALFLLVPLLQHEHIHRIDDLADNRLTLLHPLATQMSVVRIAAVDIADHAHDAPRHVAVDPPPVDQPL